MNDFLWQTFLEYLLILSIIMVLLSVGSNCFHYFKELAGCFRLAKKCGQAGGELEWWVEERRKDHPLIFALGHWFGKKTKINEEVF